MEKQKILVVDDDKHIAELISLYMMKEGYETQEIYDGKEAAAAVEDFQPDLILLDLMLPGMDGYQVCTEVRKTSRVPIIMLTAKGETFDKVLGLELGADDYIIKPFETKELVALDVILPLAKQLLQEVDYEHHPIRLIGLSVSNPREEGEEKGVWEQLSFEFSDWETEHSNK